MIEKHCKNCLKFNPIKKGKDGIWFGKCLHFTKDLPWWAKNINNTFGENGINCDTFDPKK